MFSLFYTNILIVRFIKIVLDFKEKNLRILNCPQFKRKILIINLRVKNV